MVEWTKTHFTVVMMDKWLQLNKRKEMKHAAVILYPYYLPWDFLQVWENVLIRKIKLFTFSFIFTTLTLNVLDKNRYQHNASYSIYLSIDH